MSASRLNKVTLMRVFRIVSGAVAALTLVGGLAISEPSAASDRFSPDAAAAVGVLGGLAIGGAIAASQSPVYGAPVYAPPPPPVYYSPEPVYYAPPPPVLSPLLYRALQRMGPRLGMAGESPHGLPLIVEKAPFRGPFPQRTPTVCRAFPSIG